MNIIIKNNFLTNFNLKLTKKKLLLKVGDIIEIIYSNFNNNKEQLQIIKGLIISIKNKFINPKITIQRKIDNILIEQIFYYNSLKIISIKTKSFFKVKKSKLYFVKNIKNNYKKLKLKNSI